jgi:hypothetical protein
MNGSAKARPLPLFIQAMFDAVALTYQFQDKLSAE